MSTYPSLNKDQEILKIKMKDDQLKELQYKAEKHDHENILKSLKSDNEYYKKKYKSLNKKKVFMINSEILIGSVGLGVGSGLTVSGLAPLGTTCASSISFLFSISTLITNEYFSKLKPRYTKLRDWIHVITLLYEKSLKQSMVDKKIDQKEAEELKKIYNHYLDKRKEMMKNTEFKVDDIFGDIIKKTISVNTIFGDTISPEQITKVINFLAKIIRI